MKLYHAPALIWGFLLFYFTLIPSERLPSDLVDVNDKLMHLSIFFIWAGLIMLAIARYPKTKALKRNQFIGVWLLCSLLGGLIEILQDTLVTGRQGDWLDFWSNSIGAMLMVVLWSIIQGRKS